MCNDEDEFKIISLYTRDRAIADGFLVDVSDMAREAGFKWPVAVTRSVWDDICTLSRARTGGESAREVLYQN
jgi:hypothetical protein